MNKLFINTALMFALSARALTASVATGDALLQARGGGVAREHVLYEVRGRGGAPAACLHPRAHPATAAAMRAVANVLLPARDWW